MNPLLVKQKLEQFLLEDIGTGDLSSQLFPADATTTGVFLVKQAGVICGLDIIATCFRLLDEEVTVKTFVRDGDWLAKGTIFAEVSGKVRTLLAAERVILNLLQRMSGIATMTKEAADLLAGSTTKVCDTRKTIPGLRLFDKYAVTCGGGVNHRFGLYDAVMLKDNHVASAGGIKPAVEAVKKQLGHMVKVEVETECKAQVEAAVKAGADVIMFDNRTPEEIRDFVELVPAHIVTEASGMIHLGNLAEYAQTGVNYISLGALTHSVQILDISFNVEGGK